MANRRRQDGGLWSVLLVAVCVLVRVSESADGPPHMLLIFADDFGWNDIGFRNPDLATPNLDKMASEGVNMTYSYMQPLCTPSRAAFLSGIYPFKMGIQHAVFSALKNNSIPVGLHLLPHSMQDQGYATHYIGKWHLGFCNLEMTPTYRGFDTFYGMYNGKGGFYDHISKFDGYDMHDDTGKNIEDYRVAWEANMTYSTHLFTDKAIDILEKHDQSQPLFMVLSYQAVHGPLEVPQSYVDDFCSGVNTTPEQKLHCALGAAMDEGIGNVTSAMERLGYSDNLITLFISDNGGSVKLGGSNWPLRGSKITLWEGATRVTTILHSKKHLPNAPYEWNGIMHATDWYPTLMKAAGYSGAIAGIDGVDNWEAIQNNGASQRTEFIYNINEVRNQAAIRDGRYKLIEGKGGNPAAWYNPPSGVPQKPAPSRDYPPYSLYDLETDPTEDVNLIDNADLQGVVESLKTKLNNYRTELVPTKTAVKVLDGKPSKHGGAWVTGFCPL